MKKTIAMLLALALLLAFVGCQKETETLPASTSQEDTTLAPAAPGMGSAGFR